MSEYVTVVPSEDYGDPKKQIHMINRFLSKHTKSKLSVLEIIAKDNGCTIVKDHKFIIDCAGRMILPGQLMEAYGLVNTGGVRCVICKDILDWNTMLAHLQDGFGEHGHKLTTKDTIKLFARNFYDWSWHNSTFTYRGENIET